MCKGWGTATLAPWRVAPLAPLVDPLVPLVPLSRAAGAGWRWLALIVPNAGAACFVQPHSH